MPLEYLTVNHLSTKDLIRIFSKIEIHPDVQFNGTPCWIWCGRRNTGSKGWGHGVLDWKNRGELAYRVIFAWLISPIPRGRKHGELDHLCRNPPCCNPLHLELTSGRINVLRGVGPTATNAAKTHCIRGHALEGDNVYVQPSDPSHRHCYKCKTAGDRARYVKSPRPVRTHCSKGHELTEENISRERARPNLKFCKTCLRRAGREKYNRARMRQLATMSAQQSLHSDQR